MFDEMIDSLLQGATKVAPPSGADMRTEVGEYLLMYLRRLPVPRGTGYDNKFRVSGKPLTDGDWVMFKAPVLRQYLDTKGLKIKPHVLLEMLEHDFGCREFLTTDEDRKSIRGWKGNPDHIESVVNG